MSQTPLQPALLILTYLQNHKSCGSGNLGRHLVDEVIDVFNFSDGRPFTHSEDRHDPAASSAASSDKQMPLPWKMLVELRGKIDHSFCEEGTHFKPVALTRCQLVSPAIARYTILLSTSEKSTSSPTILAASCSQIAPPAAKGPMSPPIDPPVVNGQDDTRGGDSEGENPLDIFDLEAWCSSMTQDPDAYLLGGQDAAEGVHEAPIPISNLGPDPTGSARCWTTLATKISSIDANKARHGDEES